MPAISAAPTNGNPQPLGEKHADFDELAHHERRRNYLERQAEHVQHVSQQSCVIVLLGLGVDPLGARSSPLLSP